MGLPSPGDPKNFPKRGIGGFFPPTRGKLFLPLAGGLSGGSIPKGGGNGWDESELTPPEGLFFFAPRKIQGRSKERPPDLMKPIRQICRADHSDQERSAGWDHRIRRHRRRMRRDDGRRHARSGLRTGRPEAVELLRCSIGAGRSRAGLGHAMAGRGRSFNLARSRDSAAASVRRRGWRGPFVGRNLRPDRG